MMHPAYEAAQRQRWLRPDADRWLRPDAARFLAPGVDPSSALPALSCKFNPNQPRVPAGNPDGGQWTDGGGGAGGSGGINDPRVISDVDPDDWLAGEQYAQNRSGRGSGRFLSIGGQRYELTPSQAARLEVARAEADAAIARVREVEPSWRPQPSFVETVEGVISTYRLEAAEANRRAGELATMGLLPGPYAGESIPARGPKRNFTAAERREIDRIGAETGCHTCGTKDPGTKRGHFILDHQIPNRLNWRNRAQRLYPQCLTCSSRQGPFVRGVVE